MCPLSCGDDDDKISSYKWLEDELIFDGDVKFKSRREFSGIQLVGSTIYAGKSGHSFIGAYVVDLKGKKEVLHTCRSKPPEKWFDDDCDTGMRICDVDSAGNLLVCSNDANFIAIRKNKQGDSWKRLKFENTDDIEQPVDAHFTEDERVFVLHGPESDEITEFILVDD